MAALLEVDGLSVDFAGSQRPIHALRDIRFSMERGRIVGLVGESGSGKSTLSLAVLRLLAPSARIVSGTIRFDGVDILALSDEAMRALRGRRIAMVFQDPMSTLNPVLSVGAQMIDVQFRDADLSRKQKRARAVSLLARVGIPDPERRIDDFPHQFSGGMRQRISIAMALLGQPDLLIADEPTTALDVTLEAQILDLLRDLRRDFAGAILLVSHHLGVVAEFCDEVVVLYAGEMVEQAPVGELFANPRHPYTRALLDCDPGRLPADARSFPTIPGRLPDLGAPRTQCVFAARCPLAIERCRAEPPAMIDVAPGHRASCHLLGG
ncbi:MAG TPA: ABC transporter ATP-binding protein [Stellaceae bacterium]|nr:ABC transporter ATP-binding protein [Stellaceae bacterium]